MDAGRMDRRITLERFTEVGRDAFNDPIMDWAPICPPVWASKEDIRDGERWSAQEVGAEVTTRFQVRWSSAVADFNPKDRVLFGGRVYDVVAAKEIGRREGLEITANARAD
ncbi:MAG: putative head completion protein [Prokaryotic dsDNA virus sp.]|nr:MAG: putative head completion protein [Prokaryotic dsDNA virus sp.]|tara:strand:- start:105 stop:437 length:333 start_codon:yes stop_codon:yes gene_type:complete